MNKKDYETLARLAAKVKNKDKDAFVELYTRTYQQVYFIASSVVKDQYLAEDVVQEVYIAVLNDIHELKNNMMFLAWLNRIAYHTSIRLVKKQKEVLIDNDEIACTVQEPVEKGPLEQMLIKDKGDQIMKMILELPREMRVAIIMKYYEGMRIDEIATAMGCPEGTVKSRLHMAKRRLRTKLFAKKLLLGLIAVNGLALSRSMKSYAAVKGLADMTGNAVLGQCLTKAHMGSQSLTPRIPAKAAGHFVPLFVTAAAICISGAAVGLALTIGGGPGIRISGELNRITNEPVEIFINIDSRIPLEGVWIERDSGEPVIEKNDGRQLSFRTLQNGQYQVKAKDQLGREVQETFVVDGIDLEPPTMTEYLWNEEEGTVTVTVEDSGSGVDHQSSYQILGEGEGKKEGPISWEASQNKLKFSGKEFPFDIYFVDFAGNMSHYKIFKYKK